MLPVTGKMGDVNMTTADFRNRIEALDRDDLEGYSDVVEDFGAPLLEYCDQPDVVAATGPDADLDHMCCCALQAVMRGETLEQAQAHITDDHSAAPGARAILTDLHAQWTSAPA